MEVFESPLQGVKLIQPTVFQDQRGCFLEMFEQSRYQAQLGISESFVQDNYSRSQKGVLRGLHFQHPYPQGKLIQVINGKIWDVVVDVRCDSPTYGQWWGIELDDEKRCQLWISKGFAHGFVVLSEVADVVYKCTEYYHPEVEVCLKWDDPSVGIVWPIQTPILSAKDQKGVSFQKLPQVMSFL